MTSRLEDMQNVREIMEKKWWIVEQIAWWIFFKNFITINNMNLRSKYL